MCKLVFCDYCKDIFRLQTYERKCKCGKSSGWYLEDDNHAVIMGDRAIPIGINNYSFQSVATMYLFGDMPSHSKTEVGWLFDAFVYHPDNDIVKKIELDDESDYKQ